MSNLSTYCNSGFCSEDFSFTDVRRESLDGSPVVTPSASRTTGFAPVPYDFSNQVHYLAIARSGGPDRPSVGWPVRLCLHGFSAHQKPRILAKYLAMWYTT
jgi:hypothetical protein